MKIIKMTKYEIKTYFKGSTFVMPLVFTALFLYIMYSQKPVDILSSFLVSAVFLFFLMTWVGMSVAQHEDNVIEQILYFKMHKASLYYISKMLSLCILALFFCGICLIFPIIQNLVNSNTLFNRQLLLTDIICAFLICYSSSVCGAFLGNMFHPRVLKDRRTAFGLTVLFCAVGFAKEGIILQFPWLKYILWLFPPVTLPSKIFTDTAGFSIKQSVLILLVFLIYALCFGIIKSVICHKRKF